MINQVSAPHIIMLHRSDLHGNERKLLAEELTSRTDTSNGRQTLEGPPHQRQAWWPGLLVDAKLETVAVACKMQTGIDPDVPRRNTFVIGPAVNLDILKPFAKLPLSRLLTHTLEYSPPDNDTRFKHNKTEGEIHSSDRLTITGLGTGWYQISLNTAPDNRTLHDVVEDALYNSRTYPESQLFYPCIGGRTMPMRDIERPNTPTEFRPGTTIDIDLKDPNNNNNVAFSSIRAIVAHGAEPIPEQKVSWG